MELDMSTLLGLSSCIPTRPVDETLARLDQPFDGNALQEAKSADQSNCSDLRVRKMSSQARRCREQRPALGNNVVD